MIKTKTFAIFISSIFLIIVSAGLIFIYQNPMIRKTITFIFSSSNPNWKTYSPNGEFFLNCPFPIEWETKGKIVQGTGQQTIFGYTELNKAEFVVNVFYSRSAKPQTACSYSENYLRLNKSFVGKQKNFTWKDQPVTCSGIPPRQEFGCKFSRAS